MTTILLIISLCAFCGTMVGLFFGNRLVKKDEYFKSLLALTNKILTEVKFRQNTIKSIFKEFSENNKTQLNIHINDFLNCTNYSNLNLTKRIILEKELIEVKNFFLSLGTVDSQTQIFELENYKNIFTEFSAEATKNRKQKASMYVKLGFFAGLALGLIII